jgi:hypothetical protein
MGEVIRRMFRYVVPVDDTAHVIRLSHSPVAVAAAGGEHGRYLSVEFWAEHTEGAPQVKRAFRVFGTGHPLPEDARWVGTCARMPNGLVFHLFEVPAVEPWFPGGDPRDNGIEGD